METKLNTMKQLPEKWAIKTDDPEFYEWVNANKFKFDVKCERQISKKYYIHIGDKHRFWYGLDIIGEGYELITIEQWREAVKPKFPVGEAVKQDSSTSELEGYEAPFDIPKWNTKKGDLWTYTKNGWYEFKDEALPAEWVETWKPVYKAKEKKRVPKSFVDVYENGRLWGAFPDKKEAVQRVKEKGKVGCKYTYQEVDYITEE